MQAQSVPVSKQLTCQNPTSIGAGKINPNIADTWSLDQVIARLMRKLQWDQEYAEQVVGEYRRYMALAALYPGESHAPSPLVDEVWHAHLMFTRDYRDFCYLLTSEFIDHCPGRGGEDVERLNVAYDTTLARYREQFGEPPTNIWPARADIPCTGSNCCDRCSCNN
jgi:hypothetical protein